MNLKLIFAATIFASMALTACSKQDKAPASEQASAAVSDSDQVTPEQQKAIDSLDKPVLDEKNQDVPASIAGAPAEEATPATEADEPKAK